MGKGLVAKVNRYESKVDRVYWDGGSHPTSFLKPHEPSCDNCENAVNGNCTKWASCANRSHYKPKEKA